MTAANGMCQRCGAPASDGHRLCRRCRTHAARVATELRWVIPRARMGRWVERAACAGLPTRLFYDPPSAALAVSVCDRCPVRVACLAWARAAQEQGVWGGLTEAERALPALESAG